METVPDMMNFVAEFVENLPPKVAFNTTLVCEEILVNIASYAYPDGDGQLVILWENDAEKREYKLTFEDSGIPFNPLMREEPDLSVPIAERKIGGLGIMMVRKLMDTVQYTCVSGKNTLTITKVY
jgi:anti-sigma regulatory factor (Ser/Thr protein kinase)